MLHGFQCATRNVKEHIQENPDAVLRVFEQGPAVCAVVFGFLSTTAEIRERRRSEAISPEIYRGSGSSQCAELGHAIVGQKSCLASGRVRGHETAAKEPKVLQFREPGLGGSNPLSDQFMPH